MEPLKHECGVAMIRLLKPLEYYQEKYGTWTVSYTHLDVYKRQYDILTIIN